MSGYLRKVARKQQRVEMGLTKRMARKHEDLLNAIERVLVSAYRRIEEVDDALCFAAIESVLLEKAAQHPLAAMMADRLRHVRQEWPIIEEKTWRDCLLVVAQSIRRHSTRASGEVEYLMFVDDFIE